MASPEPIPSDIRAAIAREVGAELIKLRSPAPSGPGNLVEEVSGQGKVVEEMYVSYPIYTMDTRPPSKEFRELVTPTGRWHHQIRSVISPPGGSPYATVTGFATSRVYGPSPNDWEVVSVFGSKQVGVADSEIDLASEIDGAGDWIDNNIPGDPIVRLLVLPSFFVYAFWLIFTDQDQVVIIDMPEALERKAGGPFEYKTPYQASLFLDAIRRLKQVRGVT